MEKTVTIKLNNDVSYIVDARFARMSRVLNENNFEEEIPFDCDEKTFQTILNFYKFFDFDTNKLDSLPTHYHSDNLEQNIGSDNLMIFKDYLIFEEKSEKLDQSEFKAGDSNRINKEGQAIQINNKENTIFGNRNKYKNINFILGTGEIKDITKKSQVKVDFSALKPLVNICQQHDFLYIKDLLLIMMGTEFYCENSEEGLENLKKKFGVGRIDDDEIVGIIEENKDIFDELNEQFMAYLENLN